MAATSSVGTADPDPGNGDVLPRSERWSTVARRALARSRLDARRASGATPLRAAAAGAACARGAAARRRDAQPDGVGEARRPRAGPRDQPPDDALWGSRPLPAPLLRLPAVARALGVRRRREAGGGFQGPEARVAGGDALGPGGPRRADGDAGAGRTARGRATEVMFSSGNGTEKARMGVLAAAGETVGARIGYYTLQLLVNAGDGAGDRVRVEPELGSRASQKPRAERRSRGGARCARAITAASGPVGCAAASCSAPPGQRARGPSPRRAQGLGGVLHAHANVKQGELEGWISRLEAAAADLAAKLGREWSVRVEHVERVKWYAPRVRHVVADVRCVPARLASAWAHAAGASTSPAARSPAVGSPLEGSRLGSGADRRARRRVLHETTSDRTRTSDRTSDRCGPAAPPTTTRWSPGNSRWSDGKNSRRTGDVAPTSSPRARREGLALGAATSRAASVRSRNASGWRSCSTRIPP